MAPCPNTCAPTCDISCCSPYIMSQKQQISLNSQGCYGDCLNHCYDFCNPSCCSYFPAIRRHLVKGGNPNKLNL
ncbi:hypothetical protein MXB_3623 [Myxobolus squamalis]|nr:hypothetical protein MXB_3623 [Myxobolus squamalis]